MEVVVAVELETVHDPERHLDIPGLGDRGCLVQRHDVRAGAVGELAVEGRDLRPVRGIVDVKDGDRRLQDVHVAAAEGERAIERGASSRDLLRVPARAILIL